MAVRSAAIGVIPGVMHVVIHGAIAVEIPGAIRSETAALPALISEQSNASCLCKWPGFSHVRAIFSSIATSGEGRKYYHQQLFNTSQNVFLFRLVSHEIRRLIKGLGKIPS